MNDKITAKAIAYWQDRLAKFFPTSKGPTGSELDMFRAGYELGQLEERDSGPEELSGQGQTSNE